MLKKMTVLAIAIGVVAAFALPVSASADWKHHETATQQNVTIGVTGKAKFQGGLGGVECQVTSKVTFQPGTTGLVETFVPHPTDTTTNCRGTGGLAFCQIHDVTPFGTSNPSALLSTTNPWTLHTGNYQTTQLVVHQQQPKIITTLANGTQHTDVIVITTGEITSQATDGFCPVTHIRLTPGTVAGLPTPPKTIQTIALTGTLRGDLTTVSGPIDEEDVTVSGTLEIESPNGNTYSI
jgi:uncharacterized membrane protein